MASPLSKYINTRRVYEELGLTEPALRHVLRRPGAPRPALHPTARLFLWTREDVERLAAFLGRECRKSSRHPVERLEIEKDEP